MQYRASVTIVVEADSEQEAMEQAEQYPNEVRNLGWEIEPDPGTQPAGELDPIAEEVLQESKAEAWRSMENRDPSWCAADVAADVVQRLVAMYELPWQVRARAAHRRPDRDQADMSEQSEQDDMRGRSWSTGELQRDFTVLGFSAGFVVVTRNSDGVKGSLDFGGSPRRYHSWQKDA